MATPSLLLVSDAWFPQVNGVVRTLSSVVIELQSMGLEVRRLSPEQFPSLPCPTYPDISLAITPGRKIAETYEEFRPGAVHIATEGPLGISARRFCIKNKIPFTSAYHTKFPEYIESRFFLPARWTLQVMRRFHSRAKRVMVATRSLKRELRLNGFKNLSLWTRGVDTELFRPRPRGWLADLRPISLYVGRVAVEKNLEDFLNLPVGGTKYVIGSGPMLRELQARYPHVRFLGAKSGEDLASYYAEADVFVFPSKTDTFGLVLLESLASGTPFAAYPVTGPKDVLQNAKVGAMDMDLRKAFEKALQISRSECRDYALQYSWKNSALQFLNNLYFQGERS